MLNETRQNASYVHIFFFPPTYATSNIADVMATSTRDTKSHQWKKNEWDMGIESPS